MSVAESRARKDEALAITELAHSFAHDGLNLAVLAARMLWHEGVTPDESRSTDLPLISVDTQSYLVTLQTACDIMVEVIRRFGSIPGKSGQVKQTDSFHSLNEWAKQTQQRLRSEFRFVGEDFPWFSTLNALRTALVHRGGDSLIYTDRLRLDMAVVPVGRLGTRQDGEDDTYRARVKPLMPLLSEQTRSVFKFSEQLAEAVMRVESPDNANKGSTSYVISGIYVPALHHMERYTEPTDRFKAEIAAVGLLGVGDYLAALRVGYPDGYWWRFCLALSLGLKAKPAYVSVPGSNRGGALIEWYLLFRVDDSIAVICARDAALNEPIWIEHVFQGLRKSSRAFEAKWNVLVARSLTEAGEPTRKIPKDLITNSDPERAAHLVIEYLASGHAPAREPS